MHYSNPRKSINKLGSNVKCPHPLSENGNKLHTVSARYGGKSNTAQHDCGVPWRMLPRRKKGQRSICLGT